MSREGFDTYLLYMAVAFATIGVVNLIRPNRRWLGAGAVTFGACAALYREGSRFYVVALVVGLGLLVTDAATRGPGKSGPGKGGKGRKR